MSNTVFHTNCDFAIIKNKFYNEILKINSNKTKFNLTQITLKGVLGFEFKVVDFIA